MRTVGTREARRRLCVGLPLLVLLGGAAAAPAHDCSSPEFESTFALIQRVVFENRSCTVDICHGSAASGGLDLRATASAASLIDVQSSTAPGWVRVLPGQKDESLLWRKLAAKTFPEAWSAPGRAMPLDPYAPIREAELEALRRWIEYGAPTEGVVPGTGELLDACLPPPAPVEVAPLPPPPAGTGVQIHMPRWILEATSEDEVCYASYYDVSDQVPAEFRDPSGKKFRIKGSRIRQDPLSHHLISFFYDGRTAPDAGVWGTYLCRGGERDGEPCSPLALGACGEDGGCATTPVSKVACIGFGPGDASVGFESFGITGIQETAQEVTFPDGVYYEIPLKGVVMWNSHAFNTTDRAGKLEAWLNFYFAPPEAQRYPVQRIFDIGEIFKMTVPAFSTEEVCAFHTFEPRAHLFEISTHMHQRGKRFRVFDGKFACDGGANAGQPCSPFGPDFDSPDLCAGAPCRSTLEVHAGDCDRDGDVDAGEIALGVRISLEEEKVPACFYLDTDGSRSVTVDELVEAVIARAGGGTTVIERQAEGSLLYVNLVYNDPVILQFDPPRAFTPSMPAAERSFTYCALYDNGYTDPSRVKRRSTSPEPPAGIGATLGGPCAVATHCTEGRVGEACSGGTEEERNASCDQSAGSGDGLCDACTLKGGVTTEDEMFALFGAYYVP